MCMNKIRHAYIFLSSTFIDMKSERDLFMLKVFPFLRDYYMRHNILLHAIDLRWGISEEQSTILKQSVELCLKKVSKCVPIFISFIGSRYGWIPKMEDLNFNSYNEDVNVYNYLGKSITELEIIQALESKFYGNNYKKCLFFFRDNSFLDSIYNKKIYDIYNDNHINEINKLKKYIADNKSLCFNYEATFNYVNDDLFYLDNFNVNNNSLEYELIVNLKSVIDEYFKDNLIDIILDDPLVVQEYALERFSNTISVKELDDYFLNIIENKKGVVSIDSFIGQGKTSTIARVIKNNRENYFILYRFLGEDSFSKTPQMIVKSIAYELSGLKYNEFNFNNSFEMDYEFVHKKLFEESKKGKKLVFILDNIEKALCEYNELKLCFSFIGFDTIIMIADSDYKIDINLDLMTEIGITFLESEGKYLETSFIKQIALACDKDLEKFISILKYSLILTDYKKLNDEINTLAESDDKCLIYLSYMLNVAHNIHIDFFVVRIFCLVLIASVYGLERDIMHIVIEMLLKDYGAYDMDVIDILINSSYIVDTYNNFIRINDLFYQRLLYDYCSFDEKTCDNVMKLILVVFFSRIREGTKKVNKNNLWSILTMLNEIDDTDVTEIIDNYFYDFNFLCNLFSAFEQRGVCLIMDTIVMRYNHVKRNFITQNLNRISSDILEYYLSLMTSSKKLMNQITYASFTIYRQFYGRLYKSLSLVENSFDRTDIANSICAMFDNMTIKNDKILKLYDDVTKYSNNPKNIHYRKIKKGALNDDNFVIGNGAIYYVENGNLKVFNLDNNAIEFIIPIQFEIKKILLKNGYIYVLGDNNVFKLNILYNSFEVYSTDDFFNCYRVDNDFNMNYIFTAYESYLEINDFLLNNRFRVPFEYGRIIKMYPYLFDDENAICCYLLTEDFIYHLFVKDGKYEILPVFSGKGLYNNIKFDYMEKNIYFIDKEVVLFTYDLFSKNIKICNKNIDLNKDNNLNILGNQLIFIKENFLYYNSKKIFKVDSKIITIKKYMNTLFVVFDDGIYLL